MKTSKRSAPFHRLAHGLKHARIEIYFRDAILNELVLIEILSRNFNICRKILPKRKLFIQNQDAQMETWIE